MRRRVAQKLKARPSPQRPAPVAVRASTDEHLDGVPLFGAAHLRGELVLANLDASATAATPAPVWIQIARTGKWMGHPSHPEGVEFTRQTFEQVLGNLRADPAFKAGSAPVVPYDYEHASEMDPTSGSIPSDGAPAPAWVLDLQIRAAADGWPRRTRESASC